jgi:hypothetical protein
VVTAVTTPWAYRKVLTTLLRPSYNFQQDLSEDWRIKREKNKPRGFLISRIT